MSKKDVKDEGEQPAKKKGGKIKLLVMGLGLLVLIGGGVGAGLYASQSGMLGGGAAHEEDHGPRLVPKSEQKRASDGGGEEGGHGGGHGGGGESKGSAHGQAMPMGKGGEKYASTYFAIEKEFTANLRDSVHFVQLGLAISTPYDERVIESVKTHEIAVRSAVLLALTDATEDQVFSAEGKRKLQVHLVRAINDVLKQKEGFGGVGNVYFTSFVVQ